MRVNGHDVFDTSIKKWPIRLIGYVYMYVYVYVYGHMIEDGESRVFQRKAQSVHRV